MTIRQFKPRLRGIDMIHEILCYMEIWAQHLLYYRHVYSEETHKDSTKS